jgi:tRNA modification GTPase
LHFTDTICALATPQGVGALAIIRVSGTETIEIVSKIFKGKKLNTAKANTVIYGHIVEHEQIIDEVLVSVFKNPHSFTKDDSIEISTHGSPFIVQKVLGLLIKAGCRMANPGEFTQRAYLNGQFDLAQAEAVADLIAADSAASHELALNQLKGGFSKLLHTLREELIHFASLVELELDFGEEDVTFADRDDLRELINKLQAQIKPLIASFESGNAIKEGVPVAIIGAPNAGKSTLLNALLGEDRAIVTDIAGTTRDIIEDIIYVGGRKLRIIDTAGIRETTDLIENMGIERSKKALAEASLCLLLFDDEKSKAFLDELLLSQKPKGCLWVQNKTDLNTPLKADVHISAKTGSGIKELQEKILEKISLKKQGETLVTNIRHVQHLEQASTALDDVSQGLDMGVTGDFLAQDIRLALYHIGEITGNISTNDLLANIFGKFCIGK